MLFLLGRLLQGYRYLQNFWNAPIMVMMITMNVVGEIIGNVIFMNFVTDPAPSSSAPHSKTLEQTSADRKITTLQPTPLSTIAITIAWSSPYRTAS